jgi:hypothetical protein
VEATQGEFVIWRQVVRGFEIGFALGCCQAGGLVFPADINDVLPGAQDKATATHPVVPDVPLGVLHGYLIDNLALAGSPGKGTLTEVTAIGLDDAVVVVGGPLIEQVCRVPIRAERVGG